MQVSRVITQTHLFNSFNHFAVHIAHCTVDIIADEHVSIFFFAIYIYDYTCLFLAPFLVFALRASIENRTKREENWYKRKKKEKKHRIAFKLCLLLFIISLYVPIDFLFQNTVKPIGLHWLHWLYHVQMYTVKCVYQESSGRLGSVWSAVARISTITSLLFYFFSVLFFSRSIAFTLVKYSIYVWPVFFSSFYSRSSERFVYASRIIYWLLMSNGYLFIVRLMNYSHSVVLCAGVRAFSVLSFLFVVVVFYFFLSLLLCETTMTGQCSVPKWMKQLAKRNETIAVCCWWRIEIIAFFNTKFQLLRIMFCLFSGFWCCFLVARIFVWADEEHGTSASFGRYLSHVSVSVHRRWPRLIE